MLGLGAGCGFGVVEVTVRLIDSLAPIDLLTNPATYALLIGGGAAFILLTSALQRGSVTTATAGMVLGETLGPAAIGVVWLGDRTREGMAWLAILGFAVAVVAPGPGPLRRGTGDGDGDDGADGGGLRAGCSAESAEQ